MAGDDMFGVIERSEWNFNDPEKYAYGRLPTVYCDSL
jgi:hypothetical protein